MYMLLLTVYVTVINYSFIMFMIVNFVVIVMFLEYVAMLSQTNYDSSFSFLTIW